MPFSPISSGLGVSEMVCTHELNWTMKVKEDPLQVLKRETQRMIDTFAQMVTENSTVLAVARIAVAGRRVLLQPRTEEDALRRISILSGRRHRIYTCLILSHKNQLHSNLSMTHVAFKLLTAQEKDVYVRNGLWKVDNPGAYNPLGYEARWIKSINGSHTNLIQVPAYELMNLLQGSGFLHESM